MERSRLSVPLSPLTGGNGNGNFSVQLASRERNESSRAVPNFLMQNAGRAENSPDAKTPLPQERKFPRKVTESVSRRTSEKASASKKRSEKYDKFSWDFAPLFERNHQNGVFPVSGSRSRGLNA